MNIELVLGGNRVKIGSRVYQYWNSREIERQSGGMKIHPLSFLGTVKTVTIKRTPLGELFMVVVVDNKELLWGRIPPQSFRADDPKPKFETGRTAGFDFGLKVFLSCSEGFKIESPQFCKQSLSAIRAASRNHSKKLKGSANREKARKNLARVHEAIANRRQDWFWVVVTDG